MRLVLILLTGVLILFTGNDLPAQRQNEKLRFFESKIRPVLVKNCYQCHSEESGKSKGGLTLDSKNGWSVGGDSGPAVIPHKPDESHLFLAVNGSGEMPEMPPKSRLDPHVVEDLKKWILEGAVDPRAGQVEDSKSKEMDLAEGRKFWAFQPRKKFPPTASIDSLVEPSAPPAPAHQLVRRLFLDLVGLPPTQLERSEFTQIYREKSPSTAVQTFTDRLLATEQFGEKWARHWLDIVRYADSNGGDFNLTFQEAWRYRNYVIDAFNSDTPYDQFLREQIAGDLLPYQDAAERNRQLVATGFFMVGPKMLTERDKAKMHLDIADEQLDTLGRAAMGLTLGCARCHDHKFDPIPTADYYALAGIVHSTRTADRVLMNNVNVTGWTDTDLLLDEESKLKLKQHQKQTSELQKQLDQKKKALKKVTRETGIIVDDTEAILKGPWRKSTYRPNRIGDHYFATDKDKGPCSIVWTAQITKPGKYEVRVSFGGGSGLAKRAKYAVEHADGTSDLVVNQSQSPAIDGLWNSLGQFKFNQSAIVRLSDKDAGGHVIADAIQLVPLERLKEKNQPSTAKLTNAISILEKQLASLKKNQPTVPKAMAAMEEKSPRMGDLAIRIRGETANKGRVVPRGFLRVASYDGMKKFEIAKDESGRLQLADWLTHPNHPLTSRVMANRIWQQLFGRGIVATSDNFGIRGARPTHPELLDFLAEQFVKSGWSIKSMVREIVLSKNYQQAALLPGEPNSPKQWRQIRRVAPAETIRDSILAIAGELDRASHGSVVQQLGEYAIATSGARHASLAQTDNLRQRSIYLPIVRGAVPPSLAIFDFPNPDLVTGKRNATTVPAQALFMMNSPFVRDMSQAVSLQFADDNLPIEKCIEKLYQQVLIRNADSDDMAMGKAYVEKMMVTGESRQDAIASLVQVLFSSTEFRFIE